MTGKVEGRGQGRARRATPPEAWVRLHALARRARAPIDRFLEIEAASGMLLVACAIVAVAWANSPWGASYAALWEMPIGVHVGGVAFERTLVWVVNDVLMVVFFFVVGLEIRREVYEGELSQWRRAALPVVAALGGMVVPALIYLAVAGAPRTADGWGVPVATDIAFAVGILALLGRRVPPALRVLLLALAVIDDLGAIVVIALFYSDGVHWPALVGAASALAVILVMQRAGIRAPLAYVPPAVAAWAGTYAAGIHPTIAGVAVGLLTPAQAWLRPSDLRRATRRACEVLAVPGFPQAPQDLAAPVHDLIHASTEVRSPVARLVEALHPWVAYGVMPVFAIANAGVTLVPGEIDATALRVAAGVGVGLVVGKPIGVMAACLAATRLGLAALPTGIGVSHLAILGTVAGIGFTMSLFIANLAFADATLLAGAKVGVLVASVAASVVGLGAGWAVLSTGRPRGAASTADEAERSTVA